jgi:hypothetical protein
LTYLPGGSPALLVYINFCCMGFGMCSWFLPQSLPT